MIVHFDSQSDPGLLAEFCRASESDTRPASTNMHLTDWQNRPNSLMYVLYKEKRFDGDHSGYVAWVEDNHILCAMGYNECDIDPNMILSCVRAYTLPGQQLARQYGLIQNVISDTQRALGKRGEYISFNQYNLKLRDTLYEVNRPENHRGYHQDDCGRHWRNDRYRITPFEKAGPYQIRNTQQWIVYHMYDPDYETTFLSNMQKTLDIS